MIVKMKFINISGPRNDIDRVTDQYLSRYEIQLESALSELKTVDNLRPFVELNPYREVLSKANEFVGYLPNAETVEPDTKLGLDDMFDTNPAIEPKSSQLPIKPRLRSGEYSATNIDAPVYSPPTEKPCAILQINSRIGAQIPIVS